MDDYLYIKKEEDNVSIKSEETEYRAKKVSPGISNSGIKRQPPNHNIDIARNTTKINSGLANIVSQYSEIDEFDTINLSNTVEINQTIREMENYLYRMHKEGEVTMNIFTHLNNVIEATRKWNEEITRQQVHIRDYVLNSINYNKELHSLYLGVAKSQQYINRQKRDPASPFNTVLTEVDSITLNNDNGAISSIF